MKPTTLHLPGLLLLAAFPAAAQLPVLKRSDVVFMYQASRQTYQDYGATVLAWGSTPSPQTLTNAQGMTFFGSVGMVTEFGRYATRFPQTYEQGLCRDVHGQPYKVPWLTDHQHQGVPYWWCCTRQPLFRQYLSERVVETVKAGAAGVHIDDHLGTAGGIWEGGCFCDRCVAEFPAYLRSLPKEDLAKQRIERPEEFSFQEVLREWLKAAPDRKVQQHPFWSQWRTYQLRGAAQFMAELRALAASTAGRPVPIGANAGLLWGPHLSDYRSVDLFSAEIPHRAEGRKFTDDPLVAYRLADAVGRPLASTASGPDWAFVKEQNLPGLVQGWIAFGYAAGHGLMAPNRQWCYTKEQGTHWYEGPPGKFAPLYQFVRQHADLLDDYRNHADLTVAFSQRTYDRDAGRIIRLCNQLAAANLSYQLALGANEVVDHPLPAADVQHARRLLVLEPKDFFPADQQTLADARPAQRFATVAEALTHVPPAVRVEAGVRLRVLPRVKPGCALIHLVNWHYDPARDEVVPLKNVRLQLDLTALGVAGADGAKAWAPGVEPKTLSLKSGALTVPEAGLWTLLELRAKNP